MKKVLFALFLVIVLSVGLVAQDQKPAAPAAAPKFSEVKPEAKLELRDIQFEFFQVEQQIKSLNAQKEQIDQQINALLAREANELGPRWNQAQEKIIKEAGYDPAKVMIVANEKDSKNTHFEAKPELKKPSEEKK